jgi:PAS domain S-box-containing protein
MREHAAVMVHNFSDRCAYFLVLEDFAGLESFLLKSVELPNILRLQVCEADGHIVGDVESGPDMKQQASQKAIRLVPPAALSATTDIQGDELVIWHSIEAGDQLGWIKATYSLASIRKVQSETLIISIFLSLFWGSCSVVLLLFMLRPLVQSISTLTKFARDLNTHKGSQVTVKFNAAEMKELGSSLNYASTKLYASEQELIRGQETLQEQYSTLHGILESTDDMIYSVDRQYRYTSFNIAHASEIRTISGKNVQLGESLLDYLLVAKDREETKRNLNRALAGEAHVTETFSNDLTSSRRYFEVSHNPITIVEAGEVIGVAVYARDITERKQVEVELRHLNRKLRALSHCNEAMLRARSEDTLLNDICRIVCNEAGYQMVWVGFAQHDAAKTVRPVAWAGFEEGYLARIKLTWEDNLYGRGPTGLAIRSGKSISCQDFMDDPQLAPWRDAAQERGYRSNIALPLKDQNQKTFGALMIYSTEPNTFTDDETSLLEELAGDLAFGITALRARRQREHVEEALQQLNDELEQRVQGRTTELSEKNAELERLNKLFVGRELRMAELKKKISQLERKSWKESGEK